MMSITYSWKTCLIMSFSACLAMSSLSSCNNTANNESERIDSARKMEAERATSDSTAMKQKEAGITNVDQDRLRDESLPMVAANMLDRVIHNQDVSKHMAILKAVDPDKLDRQLSTDALRRCFWIDLYNAYSQYFLKKDPSLYKSDRNEFFKKDQIDVAGFTVNMNDIEHGVLRRGATIWSKGHVRIPFRNDFVNKFKVDKVDWHIHFALNCGAKSCPPICVYLPGKVDEQLDKGAKYYLNKECSYDKKDNKVTVPALMNWFSDDFGNKDDKRRILAGNGIIPDSSDPEIDYKDYDWTMMIDNYKQF